MESETQLKACGHTSSTTALQQQALTVLHAHKITKLLILINFYHVIKLQNKRMM